MKAIFNYVEEIFSDPQQWHLDKQSILDNLAKLIDRYADSRTPTLDQLTKALIEEYPALKSNLEILDTGIALRKEVLEAVFLPKPEAPDTSKDEDDDEEDDDIDDDIDDEETDFDKEEKKQAATASLDQMKVYEGKMVLFGRLIDLNNLLNQQVNSIGANGALTKKGRNIELDAPGTAQELLRRKQKE
jgi:hypothetical protein